MNETTTPGSAPDLLAILERLAQAAFARDISAGDPCQYLQCKAELSAATRDAFAALRALRNQPPQPAALAALIVCNQWFQAYHNGDARPEALEAKVPAILDMLGAVLNAAPATTMKG